MIDTGPVVAATALRVRRVVELDRVRGLAIVLMLLDHLAYLGGIVEVRLTLGRLAMPLFFLLAGGLVTRLTRRHALALGLGLCLTALAPWAGSPNILVWYVFGSVVVALLGRAWMLPVLVLILTVWANRFGHVDSGYDPRALMALMALGSLVGIEWARTLGGYLPSWLSTIGTRPLLWYVGNVLAIQGVIWWLSKG